MQPRQRTSSRPAPGIALLAAMAAAPAFAQTASPDPSLVMQEHLRRIEQSAPPPPARTESEVTPPRPVAPAATAGVRVSEIEFSRSELLERQALEDVGKRYVGRTLGTADIQQMLDDIASLYRNKGILTAMPVLPRQDLRAGRMRVLLVEGRLSQVRVNAPASVDAGWVKRWFDLPENAVVRSEDLRERLVGFNQASDFTAQAQFVAGEQFGLSELAIEVTPPEKVRGWAFYETSSGTQSDSSQRLAAAGLRIVPLSLRGGRLDAAAVVTPHSNTLTGSVSLPLGTQGWRTGLAATRSTTRSSLPEQGLSVHGKSTAVTWDVGRTWALSDPWVLTAGINVGRYKSLNLFYVDPTPDPIASRAARTKLSATGLLQHEAAAARGSVRTTFTTTDAGESRYRYGELVGSWTQAIDTAGRWVWRAGASWRPVSRGPVSQQDQFQLGGGDTVRGFDSGAASGDKGVAVQLELRYRLPEFNSAQLEAYAFVDQGRAGTGSARQHLESAGAGLQTRLASGLGLDLLASRQLGEAIGGRKRLLLRVVSNW